MQHIHTQVIQYTYSTSILYTHEYIVYIHTECHKYFQLVNDEEWMNSPQYMWLCSQQSWLPGSMNPWGVYQNHPPPLWPTAQGVAAQLGGKQHGDTSLVVLRGWYENTSVGSDRTLMTTEQDTQHCVLPTWPFHLLVVCEDDNSRLPMDLQVKCSAEYNQQYITRWVCASYWLLPIVV